MGVSENNGTPKSSILIGFSIINHPFWGTPIFGNTLIMKPWPSNCVTPVLQNIQFGILHLIHLRGEILAARGVCSHMYQNVNNHTWFLIFLQTAASHRHSAGKEIWTTTVGLTFYHAYHCKNVGTSINGIHHFHCHGAKCSKTKPWSPQLARFLRVNIRRKSWKFPKRTQ